MSSTTACPSSADSTWRQLATALDGRCEPDTVLGIQLENELYDQPGHLVTLKALARECGMTAPLWTATAWGGAQLPPKEVFPLLRRVRRRLLGRSWRAVGCDLPATTSSSRTSGTIPESVRMSATAKPAPTGPAVGVVPPATCELGGGMATAYHRRPMPSGRDVTAAGHCKIGNGSVWQGYFMYVGGTNPKRFAGLPRHRLLE